jgi:hypothetical protein
MPAGFREPSVLDETLERMVWTALVLRFPGLADFRTFSGGHYPLLRQCASPGRLSHGVHPTERCRHSCRHTAGVPGSASTVTPRASLCLIPLGCVRWADAVDCAFYDLVSSLGPAAVPQRCFWGAPVHREIETAEHYRVPSRRPENCRDASRK